MADLALLTGATGLEPLWPDDSLIVPVLAEETVANGQCSYLASTGRYGLAGANASGKHQFRGLFLQPAGAGQGTSLLQKGAVQGLDVSALAYDAKIYLSDTLGTLSGTAGTATIVIGRVIALSDAAKTKAIMIDTSFLVDWP